jgi:hypothetical protein
MALSWFVIAASALSNAKGPRIALDPKIQARAKRVTIEPRDLPGLWIKDPSWERALTPKLGPVWSCNGHKADLSTLVTRGAWSSRDLWADHGGKWEVTSSVLFLGSVRQAELWFSDGSLWYPRYCAVVGTQQGATVVTSMSSLQRLPQVGDSEVGFRTLSTNGIRQGWGDFVILRVGAVCGILEFARASQPFPMALENKIIRKFASRAHA